MLHEGWARPFARALFSAGAHVVLSDVLHERGQAMAKSLGAAAHYVPMDPQRMRKAIQDCSIQPE